jgi:septin family protein
MQRIYQTKFILHQEIVSFTADIQSVAHIIIKYLRHQSMFINHIAVCGKYRTGKSYLLNKIILDQQLNGFSVGPTVNACTKGLVVWSKPLEIEHKGEILKILVIDSEGMDCTGDQVCNKSLIV